MSDRAQAGVEIQLLPQRYIERADALAHRRRQRALDTDEVLPKGLQCIFRKPLVKLIKSFLAGKYFKPDQLLRTTIRLLDSGIENPLRPSMNGITG